MIRDLLTPEEYEALLKRLDAPMTGVLSRRRRESGSMEDKLGSFIEGLVRAANANREERARREAQRRQWEEEERKRHETARLQRVEQLRGDELERQVERWATAHRLPEYVASLAGAERISLPEQLGISSLDEWLEWAGSYVEAVDPLSTSEKETVKSSECGRAPP